MLAGVAKMLTTQAPFPRQSDWEGTPRLPPKPGRGAGRRGPSRTPPALQGRPQAWEPRAGAAPPPLPGHLPRCVCGLGVAALKTPRGTEGLKNMAFAVTD